MPESVRNDNSLAQPENPYLPYSVCRSWLRPVDLALVAGLIALAWLLLEEARGLWRRPHYQFFPVSIAAYIYLLNQRAEASEGEISRGRVWFGWGMFGVGGVAGMGAAAMFAPWAAHLAALCFVTGWSLLRFPSTAWYTLIGWASILWITLPVPFGFDYRLVQGLQRLSGASASGVLDAMAVKHVPLGVVFALKHGKLFIDEACSGVNSLYALTAVGFLYCAWRRTSLFVSATIVCLAPIWAWAGNTVRLVVIAAALDWYGVDLSHGWQHDVLGLLVMGLGCVGLIASAGFLEGVLTALMTATEQRPSWQLVHIFLSWPKATSTRRVQEVRLLSDAARADSAPGAPVFAGSFAPTRVMMLIGLFAFAGACLWLSVVMDMRNRNRYARYSDLDINPLTIRRIFNADDLPQELGGMRRGEFKQEHRTRGRAFFGEHSVSWEYYDGDRTVLLSLDFPFAGFHPLEVCYVGTGHLQLAPRQRVIFPAGDSVSRQIEEVRFRSQLSPTEAGMCHLFYVEVTPTGEDVWRPQPGLQGKLLERAVEAFYSCFSSQRLPATFQVQIFIKNATISDADRERYRHVLVQAVERLLPKIRTVVEMSETES